MKLVLILAKMGEPWVEDQRLDLYLDHVPNPGEMIFFENNVYQILGLRNDCIRKGKELVIDATYCFVQLIKKDVDTMKSVLFDKFDKAMEEYKKINGDQNESK